MEEVETRLYNIRQDKISEDNVYQFLLFFDKLYDKFTDLEKKTFLKNFLSDVFIYEEEQKDGRILKGLRFKFPIYMNGRNVLGVDCDNESTDETVCLLFKLHEAERSKATYEEIKKYVAEYNDGMKVSNLYIAQVKRKCGIELAENFNIPRSEGAKQPQCTKEKEEAIIGALKAFQMI